MKITVKNGELQDVIEFLDGLKLSGKDSRARTRVASRFMGPFEELINDEKTLLLENEMLDSDGVLLSQEEQRKKIENVKKFNKLKSELSEEVVTIESGHNREYFERMIEVLNNYTEELSGRDAYIYDLILTELEKGGD